MHEPATFAVGRRRGSDWVRVTRGLHRPAAAPDPRRADLLAWQALLPDEAAFSALVAAELRGWHLPPLPADLPVNVAMPSGLTAPTRPGLIKVTRHKLPPPHDLLAGIRVTTAAETIRTCAPWLSLLDLVVLVDSALRSREIELLELWLSARDHRRGAPMLRRALALVDAGAASVMETLLRVLLVVCGHDVLTQHVVRDSEGLFVARGDLWLPGTRTLPEYDGVVHLERRQFRKDRVRDRRLAAAGWVRHGYTDEDVFGRPADILREADDAVGRCYDPTRLHAWLELYRDSCFSPSGRAALARRLSAAPPSTLK